MIDVIDYGGGNIGSVLRCLERLDIAYQKVDAQTLPTGKNPLLLPGVGAFGATMTNLRKGGLADCVVDWVRQGVPYLGICVGLQVLLNSSEESPEAQGLGLIPGTVVKLKAPKVPQIGWNALYSPQEDGSQKGYVYFVNSYVAQPQDPRVVLYQADYEGPFCAAIQHQNITAYQFHPEKSGAFGHQLLRSWFDAL